MSSDIDTSTGGTFVITQTVTTTRVTKYSRTEVIDLMKSVRGEDFSASPADLGFALLDAIHDATDAADRVVAAAVTLDSAAEYHITTAQEESK